MHLVFERSRTRFKSNCNILALAWAPYYSQQRHSLFAPNEPSSDFGWLVVGNVGKIVGVTLTSLLSPCQEPANNSALLSQLQDGDLMLFHETDQSTSGDRPTSHRQSLTNGKSMRPDRKSARTNYNLRGHLDEVILVKWNELYQKLATIDSKGNVLIWCKVNEKFTIQTPFYNRTKSVADFKWSNDGKTALICYTDSFILVGSTSGHRHWHSMLNLDDYHITCASWTPNDEQLLLGVSNGNIVLIDLCHNELTELVVNRTNIRAMCWSTRNRSSSSKNNVDKNFSKNMDNRNGNNSEASGPVSRRNPDTVVKQRRLSRDSSVLSRNLFGAPGPLSATETPNQRAGANATGANPSEESNHSERRRSMLAIDFANNTIKLYRGGLDDPEPKTIQVNQESYIMSWSSDGRILAVAGFTVHTTAPFVGYLKCRYLNAIKFYNRQGGLIYEHTLNYTRYPTTALTWAHHDRRIFLATGPHLHCAKVFFGIPSLSLLAASCVQRHTKLGDKNSVLKNLIASNSRQLSSAYPTDWQSHNCPIQVQANSNANQSNVALTLPTSNELLNGDSMYLNNITVFQYHLPFKLQTKIDQLFGLTIRPPFDERWSLTDIIWHVPRQDQRYNCSLICYASEREISMTSHQYRSDPNRDSSGRLSAANENRLPSDQNKIFVLYIEFQGSLIPILRARRVGFLKPEFVIFDPDDNQLFRSQRQRKVSDISQQLSSLNSFTMQRQLETAAHHSVVNRHQHQVMASPLCDPSASASPFNYNQGFAENCADLHLYTEPRVSNSSSSFGKQSLSDAEHYYNFECDTVNRQNQEKFVDLVNGRSYHQEPIALPIASNPYLLYMMQQQAGSKRYNQSAVTAGSPPTSSLSSRHSGGNKRQVNKHKTGANRLARSGLGLMQSLTENHELVRIKSNIWGTKFKLLNVENRLIKQRSLLGSVLYKASILHLQPRQIFLNIKDMSNYCCLCSKHHHSRPSKSRPIDAGESSFKNENLSLLDLPNSGELDSISPLRSSRNEHRRGAPSRAKSASCSDRSSARLTAPLDLPGRCARINEPPTSSECIKQQDDILTLSVCQDDQIKVQMSSQSNLQIDHSSSLPGSSANTAQMDDFLATNKTLKSIQTITRMIVDLSSKASNDCNEDNLSSPSKLVKLSNDGNTSESPQRTSAARFVAPDTPVHRPRRVSTRQLSTDLFREREGDGLIATSSQSANNTPLKVFQDSGSAPSARWRSRRRKNHQSALTTDPLPPPPPPAVPMARRLSSSAKRFIDGSLRSLYGGSGSGYSTSSDLEPDESEPLVAENSFGGFSKQARNRLMSKRNLSQPSTPSKSGSSRREETYGTPRKRVDLMSLGDQLVHRLARKHPASQSESSSSRSTGQPCNRYAKAASRLRDRATAMGLVGTPRTDSEPVSSSSSSDCSDLSSSDDDQSATDGDFESAGLDLKSGQSNRLTKGKRKGGKFSTSVKDLRELDQVKLARQPAKSARNKQRRLRRKSVCLNTSCCCAKEFKLNNRPPVWNELSQIYQLDFGGRVTQESAKNLQIDFDGNLVSLDLAMFGNVPLNNLTANKALQFGRIDRCTYTLDYKYPFNAVQAMAIALASLTQRLK